MPFHKVAPEIMQHKSHSSSEASSLAVFQQQCKLWCEVIVKQHTYSIELPMHHTLLHPSYGV